MSPHPRQATGLDFSAAALVTIFHRVHYDSIYEHDPTLLPKAIDLAPVALRLALFARYEKKLDYGEVAGVINTALGKEWSSADAKSIVRRALSLLRNGGPPQGIKTGLRRHGIK